MARRLSPALSLGLLLGALPASGATYYVSTSGNNANPGTQAQPWRTIQKAASTVNAGDTVLVRGGTYAELVTVQKSGSAVGGPVTFKSHPGETAVLDGASVTVPAADSGGFYIPGRGYVVVEGFEIRNFRTSNADRTPAGIRVDGASHHVVLRNNKIHHIENTNSGGDGNAFGIVVYGDSSSAITGLVITGNELFSLATQNSECLTVNGNVDGFEISDNKVHDCQNIGIDCIGFEGVGPTTAVDFARNGVVRGNQVWNISSFGNPAYGNEYSAGGIYVDGGANIVIERNTTWQNDIGIEVASEKSGRNASAITVRNNFVYRNRNGGLYLGGYDAAVGGAKNIQVLNNTFWQNDTRNDGNGEIVFQYDVAGCTVAQNIVVAGSQSLLVGNYNTTASGVTFDWNLYFAPAGPNNSEWQWRRTNRSGFNTWKSTIGGDSHALFADPRFVSTVASAPDLHLKLDSPAIDAGDPARTPGTGELDIDAQSRLTKTRMDLGADELRGFDAWRLQKFPAAPGGASALALADPDGDGVPNVVEYALGMEPTTPDAHRLPAAGTTTVDPVAYLALTWQQPLTASDVVVTVPASSDLHTWLDGQTVEADRSVAAGVETITFRDTVPLGTQTLRALRLQVALP